MQIDLENTAKKSLSEKTLMIKKIDRNLIKVFYKIRIGKLTYLPFSREFMDFIVREKIKGGY
jgi:hypothetical protein